MRTCILRRLLAMVATLLGVSIIVFVMMRSVKVLPGLVIFDLIVEEGEVCGAFGFSRNGNPCLIRSRAIVLSTGGAGAMYRRNDNQRSILGVGYALAIRAGLPLFDLEFVQFYPFALGEPRLSSFLLYPPYPKEVRLFDEKKEDLLERFGLQGDLNRAIIVQRDRLSIDLYQAAQNGDVFFDLTQVPPEKWEYYPLNFLKKSKFPFLERPFLISPAVHFFMGGVEIDEAGRTSLPGLYAAGEVAWGIHGANRLGGNALTECAVFGAIGGQSAAEYVREKERQQGTSNLFPENVTKKWDRKVQAYLKRRRGSQLLRRSAPGFRASIATGPAADNDSPFASVSIGSHGSFDKVGLAARMAAKNLKAVLFNGIEGLPFREDHPALSKATEKILQASGSLSNKGFVPFVRKLENGGEAAKVLRGGLGRNRACYHCPWPCMTYAGFKKPGAGAGKDGLLLMDHVGWAALSSKSDDALFLLQRCLELGLDPRAAGYGLREDGPLREAMQAVEKLSAAGASIDEDDYPSAPGIDTRTYRLFGGGITPLASGTAWTDRVAAAMILGLCPIFAQIAGRLDRSGSTSIRRPVPRGTARRPWAKEPLSPSGSVVPGAGYHRRAMQYEIRIP